MSTLANETHSVEPSLLGSLLTDDTFWPTESRTIEETGLTESFVESLLLKTVLVWYAKRSQCIGANGDSFSCDRANAGCHSDS